MPPSMTGFFPAYNDSGTIASMVVVADMTLRQLTDDYEVIVVNDGSRDRTAEIVIQLGQANPRVRLVSHERNQGYGAAVWTGFTSAVKDLVFLTDGDKQFDVRELAGFLPLLDRADLVIGYRRPRADPWVRRLYGWGWNALVNLCFGYTARDVDCAFKLFPRRVLAELNVHSTGHTFSPELIIKARRAGYRLAEVRVSHYPRLAGQPKGARPDAIIRALYELAKLRLEVRGTALGVRSSKLSGLEPKV